MFKNNRHGMPLPSAPAPPRKAQKAAHPTSPLLNAKDSRLRKHTPCAARGPPPSTRARFANNRPEWKSTPGSRRDLPGRGRLCKQGTVVTRRTTYTNRIRDNCILLSPAV
ncbi:hypothetical protein NDU88_006336 [Pleurodeles waltl]|uniref:Uncharacterized protein n=1 Tax=Pleurodeles waltl TaxID=8319 RepID=A0AAV7WD65_PLEWA|nr:hypothetical protein NDU88_006336 [Pleurodeles waltl]